MKLLYYAPASFGGLANYAQEQADALGKLGIEVSILCSPEFIKRPGDAYNLLPFLPESKPKRTTHNKLIRGLKLGCRTLLSYAILHRQITSGNFKQVLFVAYAEYFSPLWYRKFLKLANQKVVFGAVVQEPIRNLVLGPRLWHQWSVACAYKFLREAFVHHEIVLDTISHVPGLTVTVIPYGQHRFPPPSEKASQVRSRFNIPLTAVVLLAFGHIRDDKNLDFSIEALKSLPECHLIIAGSRQTSNHKPESHYINLAESLGVSSRCHWILEYIPESEASNLFTASDLIMLTYSSSFRSASGVLNLAAHFKKPAIVSSGAGSLKKTVQSYEMGIWIEPDEASFVSAGVKKWIQDPPTPQWERYLRENTWHRNAEIVRDRMFA